MSLNERIRTDSSPSSMVEAIEENLLAFWRMMTDSRRVLRMSEEPDCTIYGAIRKTGAFHDCVLRTRFTQKDAETKIDETLTKLGWPRQSVIWWALPSSTPRDIGARLLRRGFASRGDLPGMALGIADLKEEELSPGLEIEVVRDAERFAVMSETMQAGFETPADVQRVFHDAYVAVGFDDPRWRAYLGLLHGKPAGTTILFTGGGVAGIYGVAVRPEARRCGVAAALTTRALRDAREIGYGIATLRASEMGKSVYKRLGFRTYCTIAQYIWLGETD